MTLDKLYELVIHQLIYGILRIDVLTVFDYNYLYYGVANNSIGTIVLERHDTSYVLKMPVSICAIQNYRIKKYA